MNLSAPVVQRCSVTPLVRRCTFVPRTARLVQTLRGALTSTLACNRSAAPAGFCGARVCVLCLCCPARTGLDQLTTVGVCLRTRRFKRAGPNRKFSRPTLQRYVHALQSIAANRVPVAAAVRVIVGLRFGHVRCSFGSSVRRRGTLGLNHIAQARFVVNELACVPIATVPNGLVGVKNHAERAATASHLLT